MTEAFAAGTATAEPDRPGAPPVLAAFVSPHGFGHSARVAAVVNELARRVPGLQLELFTTAPRWFFAESLHRDFAYHPELTDIGLVQHDALHADAVATVAALDELIPPSSERLDGILVRLRACGARAVLCDVSAIGIAAARRADLPSVLLENFTWDWIYRNLEAPPPRLLELADELSGLYRQATLRLQCAPVCAPMPGARQVGLVARRRREDAAQVRHRLGLPAGAALVLLTMGGIEWRQENLRLPRSVDGRPVFLLTLGGNESAERRGQWILLPHHSDFHHPDLVATADAVLGKLGYSTVAEVAAAGVPMGYVTRPGFPESPVLERWVEEHLACREVTEGDLRSGALGDDVTSLLRLPRKAPVVATGAGEVADVLAEMLGRGREAAS